MTDSFDKEFWETHWAQAAARDHDRGLLPNPHLAREVGDLRPGSALDAGCGDGTEAIWLAVTGWEVTAADISVAALERARQRAARGPRAQAIKWVEADLSVWAPDRRFDLVMTHYAHPAMPQLGFYERIAGWVAPGGTLLIVGHLDTGDHEHRASHEPRHGTVGPLASTLVTPAAIAAILTGDEWEVVTADEVARTVKNGAGSTVELHDVVVRAVRTGGPS